MAFHYKSFQNVPFKMVGGGVGDGAGMSCGMWEMMQYGNIAGRS